MPTLLAHLRRLACLPAIAVTTFWLTSGTAVGQSRSSAPDGSLLDETPYRATVDSYQAWIDLLKSRAPNDPRDRPFEPDRFARDYSQDAFERLVQGRDVLATRIVYASDGLKIAGFRLRPRTSDGQKVPLVIYNRGGNRDFGAVALGVLVELSEYVRQGYEVLASQ